MELQSSLFDEDFPEYSINKPIRLIELFAGMGTQIQALKRLGVDVSSHFVCEFDKYAVAVYNAMHKTDFETTDIREISGKALNIINPDDYCYLMTYSFPCLTDDSLILTKKGYKELKYIEVGDEVLTKSNTWHKVAKKFNNGVHDTCFVNAFGFKKIHCTLNHKFLVREMYRKYPTFVNGKRGNERYFKDPVYKEVKDITRKDYFGIPVIKDEIPFYSADLDFWYMIGYYIGDGWISKNSYLITLACNDSKLDKLKPHLDKLNLNYKVRDMNLSCHKVSFTNKEIYSFIEKYIGSGDSTKKIAGEIIMLPEAELTFFLKGYIESDGNFNKSGKSEYVRISSINQNLIYSTAAIVEKLYKRPVSINVEKKRKKEHFIDGRKIKSNFPLIELKFKFSTDKQDKAFYEDGYIWYPFYNIELANKENVFNIEVEEDHSYIVNGCISKNCTDLSVAGKQAGMKKDSGTRSGLLWQVERLLRECKELADSDKNYGLPQVLVMENVTQVHSAKNMSDFQEWINFLNTLGYTSYYDDINAKTMGIPQNRDRTFMISILGEYDYSFPETIPLEYCMADVLEDEVEDKFFINNEKADKLIEQLIVEKKIPELDDE